MIECPRCGVSMKDITRLGTGQEWGCPACHFYSRKTALMLAIEDPVMLEGDSA